jgi:Ca2+-binding RTX toxin-like protein
MSINTNLGVLAAARWPANQAISGFTDFSVQSHPGLTHFAFTGDIRDESLHFDGLRKTTLFQVGMGSGDDDLTVISAEKTHRHASFSGGRGADWLALVMPTVADVDLDLARGRLSTGRGKGEETVAARGFEDATVVAPDVELVGTGSANLLRVNACRATVEGRGGRDTIAALVTGSSSAGTLWCRDGRRMRFLGQGGADRLFGSAGRDVLVGGPGRDRADGDRGRDTCTTEVTKRCEVRR